MMECNFADVHLMNGTTTYPDELISDSPVQKPVSTKPGPLPIIWTVALLATGGEWFLLATYGKTANPNLLAFIGGSMVLLLAGVSSLLIWTASRKFHNVEADLKRRTSDLKCELARSRLVLKDSEDAMAEAKTNERAAVNEYTALKEQFDKLKLAQKESSQQRQALESSRTVLQLHVQARTDELQKLQRRNEMILNAAGDGICGLDLEGRITFVNPSAARITGWTIEELGGKKERDIFGDPKADFTGICALNEGESIMLRKDGQPFPVECVRTPLQVDGRSVGAVLVFRDISERKRSDEALTQRAAELTRSNAELEQFAFVASHDLQEPLRKIQAFGDRLKMKCQGVLGAEAGDYLERMQSASARMRRLIDDLLTFSRVIRRSEPFATVDLNAAARDVLSDLEVSIDKSKGRLEIGDLPSIEADPVQMRQLLLNLIGNALKFQPAGGQPLVKVQGRILPGLAGEDLCELVISDNGIGFEEKYAEKIFVVFQRLHGRMEYEGTGVGLAVCRRITDRHHGSITAQSQPGQGATFRVVLPVRQSKLPVPPAA